MSTEISASVLKQLVRLTHQGARRLLDEPEVYPLEGGWIEIEWSAENRSVAIEICNNGSTAITMVENQYVKQELDPVLPSEFADRVDEAFAWLAEDAFDWDQIGDIG